MKRKHYKVADFCEWPEWQAITFFVGIFFLCVLCIAFVISTLVSMFGYVGFLMGIGIIAAIAVLVGLKGNVKRMDKED